MLFLLTPSVSSGPRYFADCIGPQLGYNLPPTIIAQAVQFGINQSIIDLLKHTLVIVLALHPVLAGLCFIAFINALFLGSRAISILALIFSVITALLSTILFAVDMIIVTTVRKPLTNSFLGTFGVTRGNGLSMMIVAAIMTWMATVLLFARACYCCGVRR
jgi:hypothetical protein